MLLLTLFLMRILCWQHRVEATGSLKIRLIKYDDLTRKLADGACCHPPCSARFSCHNIAEVCYRDPHTSGPNCTDSVMTGVFLTKASPSFHKKTFTLDESLGNGVTNPIALSFSGAWLGQLNVTFTIWNNYTNPPGHVITLQYANSTAGNGNLESPIIVRDSANTKLITFAWAVACDSHFYGDDCSTFCTPVNDNNGHYNCSSNGTKICLPGWNSPQENCTNYDDCMPSPCINGFCLDLIGSYICNCSSGFTGTNCDTEQPTTELPSASTERTTIEISSSMDTSFTVHGPTAITNTTSLVTEVDTPTGLVAGDGDEKLQQGDFAAIGVGVSAAIVITLLVAYIIWLKTGCSCCVCRATIKSQAKQSTPYGQRTSHLPESRGSLGSLSETQLWPEKRVQAPSLQRPRLNLHYYPESHPDWDVTQM